jgi:hypothetical protein
LNAPENSPFSLLWTADETRPQITLELVAANPSREPAALRFRMHPEYHLGGRAESGVDTLLFPTESGVFKLPFWIDLGERPAPVLSENWWAVDDAAAGMTMRQDSSEGWDPPRIWFGGGFYSVEMVGTLSVPPGETSTAWLRWTLGEHVPER